VRISVVLSTYRQPRLLELALWGYAAQTRRGFELVLADDGSGPETRAVVERMRRVSRLDIVHVWHPDRGFRKTEILNRAIAAASGDYLVFSDGDTIPRRDFVQVHARLAEPRRFLSGGYLHLPPALSERLTADDVRAGRATSPRWLRANGWRPGHRRLRLMGSTRVAAALDHLTTTPLRWHGMNASTWKRHLLEVNGFDLEMGYGGEDAALGERLVNLGIRPKRIRFRAPAVHLWHPRPYFDEERIARNNAIRERIRTTGETRTPAGLMELYSELSGDDDPASLRTDVSAWLHPLDRASAAEDSAVA
jgi:glycosyltransferase involved in cell wall biosynthesis